MTITEQQRNTLAVAVGHATACWDGLERAGAFRPEKAIEVVDQLCDHIGRWLNEARATNRPIRYVTDMELLEELADRLGDRAVRAAAKTNAGDGAEVAGPRHFAGAGE